MTGSVPSQLSALWSSQALMGSAGSAPLAWAMQAAAAVMAPSQVRVAPAITSTVPS